MCLLLLDSMVYLPKSFRTYPECFNAGSARGRKFDQYIFCRQS